MNYKNPLVSVVMPAYNAGDFLCPAVDSILSQTYKNFELIIVNDASTDGTSKILNSYKKSDKRVKVFTNKTKHGVSKSASLGISKARGEFIARMDADDIASPNRLQKQVTFLLKNKSVVAVGGQCELIDKNGVKIGEKRFPTDDKHIKSMIFANVPLQQPTLMVNRSLTPADFTWYDKDFSSAEEIELIFKLFRLGEVRNVKDVVLKYRMHSHNTSLIDPRGTFYLTLRTRIRAIFRYKYVPTFGGVLATLAQIVFISIVPNSWIYPVYSYVRGIRKVTLRGARIGYEVVEA